MSEMNGDAAPMPQNVVEDQQTFISDLLKVLEWLGATKTPPVAIGEALQRMHNESERIKAQVAMMRQKQEALLKAQAAGTTFVAPPVKLDG
jgi:hypothetical protein